MSPAMVMPKVIKFRGSMSCFLLCSSLLFCCTHVHAKPANAAQTASSSSALRPAQPVYTARSLVNSGKKVLTSWNEDGTWQASARLPTSSQTGGNERSRYKIRRDGSLSLALQIPKTHTKLNKYHPHSGSLDRIAHDVSGPNSNWAMRDGRVGHHHNVHKSSASGNSQARQYSPAELRSFSVVISDVDVMGNYNKINDDNHVNEQDAYAKAGVSSYHLKSNSIHRMNASWKLKPGHGSPTSSELLDFLSYFANGDTRATRSDPLQTPHATEQRRRPLRKILGQEPLRVEEDESGEISNKKYESKDEIKQPFLTWQESSRKIPVMSTSTEGVFDTVGKDLSDAENAVPPQQEFITTLSSTELDNIASTTTTTTTDTKNGNANSSSNELNESKVVLHELISTLEELNKNIEKEEANSKSASKVAVVEEKSKVNQTRDVQEEAKVTEIPEDGYGGEEADDDDDTIATFHNHHQTEIDQTSSTTTAKPENQQQVHVVDVEMSESSSFQRKNGREKEGDVFVQNDAAKFITGSNSNKNNTATEDNFSSSSFSEHSHQDDDALDGMKATRRRSAKSAFSDSTKSTNRNDDDNNNNTASTSATSLKESTDNVNSRQRMKITDPQQTASDLKKLMSLILKSDGNRNAAASGGGGGGDGKSGTQVVNIVITPNQDESSSTTANHPQLKNPPQKILFLKTPQVKQMLDIALTDPALSTAAQKIAAALETNPFPNPIPANIHHTFDDNNNNNLPSYILNTNNYNDHHDDGNGGEKMENIAHEIGNAMGQHETDTVPSTPDGFPLTGNGFLNLHHPNLQFHQALHHMVVNGTTPTSINATTKTNIINIFVINFKENNKQQIAEATGVNQQAAANQSPFRINIKPSPRPQYYHNKPKPPLPFNIKPLLIESVRPTTSNNPLASLIDPSLLFNNKMGLAAAGASNEDDENEGGGGGMSSEKNFEPNKHFDMDHGLSNPDKINIFDLLPGDIGTVTAVQYAPGVGAADSTETIENHNSNNNNGNQTVSHFLMNDSLNASQQHQQGSNASNNSNSSNMMPVTLPSPHGDYFADFLPDRSREPPGSLRPQENENINSHNILSILTSSRKPTTASAPYLTESNATQGVLPPSLAHLEWIFKNQPPPKPQISPQNDATALIKRKGQTSSNNNEGNADSDAASESMMEPDETINSPSAYHGSTTQELIQYLLHLQNVSRPLLDSNSLSEMPMNNSVFKPQIESNLTTFQNNTNIIGQLENAYNSNRNATDLSSETENGPIVEYTTKPPAFWKLNNKLQMGSFSNTEEALNNRLRKLLTAFGYSALPTLAAGAAATWPYWVPLVATGRRRRRRRSAILSRENGNNNDDGQIAEIIKRRGHQFLSNLAKTSTARLNNETSTASSMLLKPPILAPSDRQLLSKSTKNSKREGASGEQKWIKVDVITATAHPFSATSSSPLPPTLLNFEKMNSDHHHRHHHHDRNETGFHIQQSHNNDRILLNAKNNGSNNKSKIEHKHDSSSALVLNDDNNNDHSKQKSNMQQQEKKDGKITLSAEQQLDVPLLKNFLKNVLQNELSLSNMNMNTPSPLVFAYSSQPANNAQNIRRPLPPAVLPFLSASSSLSSPPAPLYSSSPSPPPNAPMVLSQIPIFTPTTLNTIITKNGHHHHHHHSFLKNPHQQTGGNNENHVSPSQNSPFFRPSSSPLAPPSLLPFPEHDNKGEDDSAEEQEMIASSDKKVISVSTFATPSPTSVYIHNRGDGTTSVVTTKAPAFSASLVHWQNDNSNNNNSPWGSSFGGVTATATTTSPDKISSSTSSSSVTSTLANIAASAIHGHNDDMIHNHHHSSLSSGQTFNDANDNHHSSSSNVDYFLNHFNQSNKRLQKIKLADSILASERSYTSAALLPLWFPIFFGNHNQLSSKLKHVMATKKQNH